LNKEEDKTILHSPFDMHTTSKFKTYSAHANAHNFYATK